MAQMSDSQKPSHEPSNEPDNETDNTQVFKIDHMVVIHDEPIHKVLFKLATWFAILWVCVIVVIYFMEPNIPTGYLPDCPKARGEKMIIIYNDDGQSLE